MTSSGASRRQFLPSRRGARPSPRHPGWPRLPWANDGSASLRRRRRQGLVGPYRRSPPARTSRSSPSATSTRGRSTSAGRPSSIPQAKRFTDWRELLDEPKDFDAVIVSTPDHMHAPIALPAMQLGKHVFCQKPLTHTVFEARQMRLAAEKYARRHADGQPDPVALGLSHGREAGPRRRDRQGEGSPLLAEPGKMRLDARRRPARRRRPGARDAALGRVARRRAGAAVQGEDLPPVQLAGLAGLQQRPARRLRLPHPRPGLHGPGADRPDHDPGRGAADQPRGLDERSTVHYEFPGTEHTAGKTLKLTWYDGEGHFPPREGLGLPEGLKLPGSGSVLMGEKGSLVIPHVAHAEAVPARGRQGLRRSRRCRRSTTTSAGRTPAAARARRRRTSTTPAR